MESRMTGKSCYLTTLGEWQRHAARFANSHFVALDPRPCDENAAPDAATRILVLIEADEGVQRGPSLVGHGFSRDIGSLREARSAALFHSQHVFPSSLSM
jgi:hypothetical protein